MTRFLNSPSVVILLAAPFRALCTELGIVTTLQAYDLASQISKDTTDQAATGIGQDAARAAMRVLEAHIDPELLSDTDLEPRFVGGSLNPADLPETETSDIITLDPAQLFASPPRGDDQGDPA